MRQRKTILVPTKGDLSVKKELLSKPLGWTEHGSMDPNVKSVNSPFKSPSVFVKCRCRSRRVWLAGASVQVTRYTQPRSLASAITEGLFPPPPSSLVDFHQWTRPPWGLPPPPVNPQSSRPAIKGPCCRQGGCESGESWPGSDCPVKRIRPSKTATIRTWPNANLT